MKTPTQYRYTCDQCQTDCTQGHIDVYDNTPGAIFLHLFDKGGAEKNYCSVECLLTAVSEQVAAAKAGAR